MKSWFLKYRLKKISKNEVSTLAKVYGLDEELSEPEGSFYTRHRDGVQFCMFLAAAIVIGALFNIGNEDYLYLSNIGKVIFSLFLLLSWAAAFVWCKFFDNFRVFASALISSLVTLLSGGALMVLLTVMNGIVVLMTGARY